MTAAAMPLPPDLELAGYAAKAYAGPWDWQTPGYTHALKAIASTGHTVIAIEGTTLDGWAIIRDIRILARWWRTGLAPFGAADAAESILAQICLDCAEAIKNGMLIVTGHSLGGQIGFLLAGALVDLGHPPAAAVMFEPSRSGFFKLRRLIAKIPRACWYDNGSPVPTVPMPYFHPAKRIALPDAAGAGGFILRLLRITRGDIEQHKIARIIGAMAMQARAGRSIS